MVAPGKHAALGSNRHYPQTYHFLQLKDRAGGPVPQRCSLRSRNVAAGSPTWIWLEFPQSRHPIPPPSPSPPPPHLHQENLSVHKSYHDFRANSHISLPPPVTLLPGRGFLGPGCPGCPGCWLRGPHPPPHSWLSLACSCLGYRPECPAVCPPGAEEKEGQNQEECGSAPTFRCLSPSRVPLNP